MKFVGKCFSWKFIKLRTLSSCSAKSKGQLISKCLFDCFKFFQKNNENKSNWGITVVKTNFLCSFYEKLRIPKSPFEINWPLEREDLSECPEVRIYILFTFFLQKYWFGTKIFVKVSNRSGMQLMVSSILLKKNEMHSG